MESRDQHRLLLIPLVLFLLGGLAACSDSPTDPAPPDGGTGPDFTDVPDIPRPATPSGEVPARSETMTAIKQLKGSFRPRVVDAYGHWSGYRQCGNIPTKLLSQNEWARARTLNDDYRHLLSDILGRNLILQEAKGDRLKQVVKEDQFIDCNGPIFIPGNLHGEFRGAPLEAPVYIRRDRHWELKPLEGGAGNYLLVYPQTSGEVTTTFRQGTETTQTEEFGRSLTLEVGLGYGPLSASVSGTLSETFSSSVSVSQEKEESFAKTVTGKEGKIIQFMVWELVETYSFSDADGNELTSENYVLAPESVTLRGTSIALQSTEFDLQ